MVFPESKDESMVGDEIINLVAIFPYVCQTDKTMSLFLVFSAFIYPARECCAWYDDITLFLCAIPSLQKISRPLSLIVRAYKLTG